MALEITYNEILREVGRYLGLARVPDDWSEQEQSDIADIIKGGLRSFYWPAGHCWSFLMPTAAMSLAAEKRTYDLPDDFTNILPGGFTYAVDSKQAPIIRKSESEIRALWAKAELSGPPVYFAIRAKVAESGGQTRYEALFYPVPSEDHILSFSYCVTPPALESGVNENHLGGAVHSETVLEACLAAAEKTMEDKQDIHSQRFAALLANSIALDKGEQP
jgi:hypothetical protein